MSAIEFVNFILAIIGGFTVGCWIGDLLWHNFIKKMVRK